MLKRDLSSVLLQPSQKQLRVPQQPSHEWFVEDGAWISGFCPQ
jgi:hypothetical protein